MAPAADEEQAAEEKQALGSSDAHKAAPPATTMAITNPWGAIQVVPALEEEEQQEQEETEDWVMLDEGEITESPTELAEGPLDQCPAPLAEFVVPTKAALRNERWHVLGYPL